MFVVPVFAAKYVAALLPPTAFPIPRIRNVKRKGSSRKIANSPGYLRWCFNPFQKIAANACMSDLRPEVVSKLIPQAPACLGDEDVF
jgi:hypothetical protein